MAEERQIRIDPLTGTSLYLELLVNGNLLGKATGIAVQIDDVPYLITNWHVLSGRHPDTNAVSSPTGATPDEIRIAHHANTLGNWKLVSESLLDADRGRRWLEHPAGRQVDLAALPLLNINDDITIHAFDLALADTDMVPQVAMPVSIIGFPLGLASLGAFPIWKTGHIASDPDINYQGAPAFIIDATTRGGMSGSPVVLRLFGGYATESGHFIMAGGGPRTRFLGLYSGRIHVKSEIGLVWRPHLITELLEAAH